MCDAKAGTLEWLWQGWCCGVAEDGGVQVVFYYIYLIPFHPERFMGDLGDQLLAFRKGKIKISWERKEGDQTPAIVGVEYPLNPNNLHPRPPAHPSLSLCSKISICCSNKPASGPCGQSRSRPVIKMKWAVDPMVPFRRVEH